MRRYKKRNTSSFYMQNGILADVCKLPEEEMRRRRAESVELLPDDRPPTRKQEQLIRKLVNDFPDTKTLDEYADYAAQPTKAHASALITAAVESHWDELQQSEVYMRYIATRPRAERLGSHGLFGDEDYADLRAAMDELEHYTGNVWTHIISLKREDAAQLGYAEHLHPRDEGDEARRRRHHRRGHRQSDVSRKKTAARGRAILPRAVLFCPLLPRSGSGNGSNPGSHGVGLGGEGTPLPAF